MSQYKEYSKPMVGNPGCTYSNLVGTYANGQQMLQNAVPGMNQYDVPKMCPSGSAPNYPPRYDTLSHGQNYLCGGYFSMKGAYPQADCTSCNAPYTKRPCDGHIDCSAPAPAPQEPVVQEGMMSQFKFW